jgi:5-methylcytosine-specific restriction endonuclease McrA
LADRQEEKAVRRARKRGAFVANVSRLAIFERDGWVCQLCKEPLDREAQAPAPLSPTIDHIVPLAVGGTHEPRNVQAAHFICNSVKGHRGHGSDQLRLVG